MDVGDDLGTPAELKDRAVAQVEPGRAAVKPRGTRSILRVENDGDATTPTFFTHAVLERQRPPKTIFEVNLFIHNEIRAMLPEVSTS